MTCREKTACFTGHRELRDPYAVVYSKTRAEVEALIGQGYRFFGAGGARGFDALAAEVVLALKGEYPQIHLILVLPFPNQYAHESGWSREAVALYEKHRRAASKVVYMQESYSSGCYYKRNRHLVDCSSVCIAYQYQDRGGTAYTTDYAARRGLRIRRIF